MSFKRFPVKDPRTVARDIPGILDSIFPQLNASLAAYLNKNVVNFHGLTALSEIELQQSSLKRPMLFELASARAEQILRNEDIVDWSECLHVASARQQRHYDAKIPVKLALADEILAEAAATNLVYMLKKISENYSEYDLKVSPTLPGYGWIASGNVDFSVGPVLIEVKHTVANYSSADFRQVLMYWILSYSNALENNAVEFTDCVLLNPRRNSALAFKFSFLVRFASSGLGKIEALRLFESIIDNQKLIT